MWLALLKWPALLVDKASFVRCDMFLSRDDAITTKVLAGLLVDTDQFAKENLSFGIVANFVYKRLLAWFLRGKARWRILSRNVTKRFC